MEALDIIFKRKSTRKFTNQEISEEVLTVILKAAMASPSCAYTRDWQCMAGYLAANGVC